MILTISLIALSTVLFVTGVVIERGARVSTPTNSQQPVQSSATTSSDPDGGHDVTPSSSQQGSTSPEQGSVSAETVFGVDLENPWVVGVFVLIWLLLVIAIVRLGRIAWVGLLLVAVGAGVLDVGEVGRQLTEAHPVVASFAVVVTLAHIALAVLALFVLARTMRKGRLSVN